MQLTLYQVKFIRLYKDAPQQRSIATSVIKQELKSNIQQSSYFQSDSDW